MAITPAQRFTKQRPCPVCGSNKDLPQGEGVRCWGFLSEDGQYAHCTRTDFAGALAMKADSSTFAHKLNGECLCGKAHSGTLTKHVNGRNRKIEQTYDYLDENAQLLFQTVRYSPKGFNQRRPDGKGGWVWNIEGVRRVLYRLPELLASTKEPVFIVEGEKDADRLISLGLTATCNPMGAGKWSNEYNGTLEGRHVVVLPDIDIVGQRHGQAVANSLYGSAASVRYLELPGFPGQGKDVTDWLNLGHTADELMDLAEKCPEWGPELFVSQPSLQSQISKSGNGHHPNEAVSDASGNKTKGFKPYFVCQAMISEGWYFAKGAGQLYVYQGGRYLPGEALVKEHLIRRLGSEWLPFRSESVVRWFYDGAPSLWERPPSDQINLKNGILDRITGELVPHSSDFLSPVQLPIDFDPDADCPNIKQFIKSVFPEDTQRLGYEIPGLLCTTDTGWQKAFLLVGRGANGKSTYLQIIEALLGAENVFHASLQDLADNRFASANLYGKLANLYADIPSQRIENSSIFKQIVGGDTISAERKHVDAFSFKPYSRFVFSANDIPSSTDSSLAYSRRWIVIEFPNSFPINHDFVKSLITPGELSGLFNLAIAAYTKAKNAEGFTESESTRRGMQALITSINPVKAFTDERVIQGSDCSVPKPDLYQEYKTWCEENGVKRPVTSQRFNKQVSNLFPGIHIKEVKGRETWNGIELSSPENA